MRYTDQKQITTSIDIEVEAAEIEENEAITEETKEPIRGLGLDDPILQSILIRNGKRLPNKRQAEAITMPLETNVRVFAPPGAGKSTVIEWRYTWMIENNINPNDIIVTTFSKSMADEAGKRISKMTDRINLDQISTIHALCYRILTRWDYASKTYLWNVPKDWEVKKNLDELIDKFWKGDEKPGYNEVWSYIDYAKSQSIGPDQSFNFYGKILGALQGGWLAEIRKEFDLWLARSKQLTFADMLYYVDRGLKNDPQFKSKWMNKWTYCVIDEGQDTSEQALSILLKLGKYSYTVSDVDQMMFRFSGAKPEVMTSDYADNIQTIKLEINYRSTHEIIQTSNQLIRHNYSDLDGPYDQIFMKDIRPRDDAPIGDKVQYSFYPTVEDESKGIADTVNEQLQAGYNPGDFFVGARTRAQLGFLEGALVKASIPFINIAGGSFWQSRHIQDVISYLRLAYDETDSPALGKVYNIPSNDHLYTFGDKVGEYCPTRYLGKEFLSKIDNKFNRIDRLLLSEEGWRYKTKERDYSIYGPSKAQDLQEFVWRLQSSLNQIDHVGQMIRLILDDCYVKYLKHNEGITDDAESGKLDDLETVYSIASEYTSVKEFLAYVDSMIEAAQKAKDKDWKDYLILSTYHRLKGLERAVMIGAGWCEGISTKSDEPRGLLPHTYSLVNPPQFGVLPTGGMSPVSDERSIGFVCISRAKDKCFLTGCAQYRDWKMEPSRFVYEAGLLSRDEIDSL